MSAATSAVVDRDPGTMPTVRVFESESAPADADALAILRAAVSSTNLAAPSAVLPDFHMKHDKEMPSSIAVATRDTIQSTLTCCSLNCGMTLVALGLERPSRDRVHQFYRGVLASLPYPPSHRRVLRQDEVVGYAAEGAVSACERLELDPSVLDGIEEGGRLSVEPFGGRERVRRELPWLVKELSRIRFGTIGPSNHFIELQEVEEVLDPEAATLLGHRGRQVTLQYHGGGGTLPAQLGVLFGAAQALHASPARSDGGAEAAVPPGARSLARRSCEDVRRSTSRVARLPVERDSTEGERLMLATIMAMNYGFAFRLRTYAMLTALARASFGATPAGSLSTRRITRSTRRRSPASGRSCTATTPRARIRPRG